MKLLTPLLTLLMATSALAAPCEWRCKIRITGCYASRRDKCVTDDRKPELTGLCPMMMAAIVAEWGRLHPGMILRSAECVTPDDEKV